MIKILESESTIGNLHFKLRILNLLNNPMKDFDLKLTKRLENFYQNKYQKVLIIANNYQCINNSK